MVFNAIYLQDKYLVKEEKFKSTLQDGLAYIHEIKSSGNCTAVYAFFDPRIFWFAAKNQPLKKINSRTSGCRRESGATKSNDLQV